MQIGGRQETAAYQILDLQPGHKIQGPAILIDDISTVVIEPECTAFITAGRDIRVEVGETKEDLEDLSTTECDPIQLAIFSHRYVSDEFKHTALFHPLRTTEEIGCQRKKALNSFSLWLNGRCIHLLNCAPRDCNTCKQDCEAHDKWACSDSWA